MDSGKGKFFFLHGSLGKLFRVARLANNNNNKVSKVKMHPKNKTKTRSQNTYHIVCRVGKQGMRPSRDSNQGGVEKCTTGSAISLGKHSDGNHAREDLPAGPSRVIPTKKKEKGKRQNWSREDYKEVMPAFYMFLKEPSGSHTENTFSIWRSRNHNVKMTNFIRFFFMQLFY